MSPRTVAGATHPAVRPEVRPAVRIAAAVAARGASDILPAVLAHHIGQGITDFYIVLHNEDGSVSKNIDTAFGTRANFTIVHHDHPDFNHGAISNLMLALARRDGFDVYLPIDSDEFYVSTDARFSLAESIEQWFVHDTSEQIHVPNKNFLAPRTLDEFTTRSLGHMTHRLEYKANVRNVDMRRRLEAMRKSISRLSNIPDAEFTVVQAGNHTTYRGRQRLSLKPPEVPFNFAIEVLHVPFRSRVTTENPLLLERAIGAADRQPVELSPSQLKKRILQTWNEVSVSTAEQRVAVTDKGSYLLYADDALNRILQGIADAGFDIDDQWCASTKSPDQTTEEYTTRVIVSDTFFDVAVTALAAHSRRIDEISTELVRSQQQTKESVAKLRERLRAIRSRQGRRTGRKDAPDE